MQQCSVFLRQTIREVEVAWPPSAVSGWVDGTHWCLYDALAQGRRASQLSGLHRHCFQQFMNGFAGMSISGKKVANKVFKEEVIPAWSCFSNPRCSWLGGRLSVWALKQKGGTFEIGGLGWGSVSIHEVTEVWKSLNMYWSNLLQIILKFLKYRLLRLGIYA